METVSDIKKSVEKTDVEIVRSGKALRSSGVSHRTGENLFRFSLQLSTSIVLACTIVFFLILTVTSWMSIRTSGFAFLTGIEWDPVIGDFGALPFFVGTILTSLLALFIAIPFSIAIALLFGEYFTHGKFPVIFRSVIELLAGIPSIIYGFWGIFFLVPIVRQLEITLEVPPYGVGIFVASVVLAIMVIPYAASISRDVINLVPTGMKEAAYALGATRFEVVSRVIIPYARSGIAAGIILALGRALGETMAVTMVIGNSNTLPTSIFSPSNTMASIIANEFAEATDDLYLSALTEIGLLLLLVTVVMNLAGKYIISHMQTNT